MWRTPGSLGRANSEEPNGPRVYNELKVFAGRCCWMRAVAEVHGVTVCARRGWDQPIVESLNVRRENQSLVKARTFPIRTMSESKMQR